MNWYNANAAASKGLYAIADYLKSASGQPVAPVAR
jgi:hypothetical protein